MPETIRSLVYRKPIEMITPAKIAHLILIQRGWRAHTYCFHYPVRFSSYRQALSRRSRSSLYLERSPVIRKMASYQTLLHWQRAGMLKNEEVVGCNIERQLVLTKDGEELLRRIAPEVMAQAVALVRASIWTEVVLGRRHAIQSAKRIQEMHERAKAGDLVTPKDKANADNH